jgi:hypothetical protein
MINLPSDAIEQFATASPKLNTVIRMQLLRAAMRQIYNLVEIAAECNAELATLIEAERLNLSKRATLIVPHEFLSPELYVEYFARLDGLKSEDEELASQIDSNVNALFKIANLIGKVIPASTWFLHGEKGFKVEPVIETTYDKSTTRWNLVICQWEDRNAKPSR